MVKPKGKLTNKATDVESSGTKDSLKKVNNKTIEKKKKSKIQSIPKDISEVASTSAMPKPTISGPWNLKLASFNVNGLRAWLKFSGSFFEDIKPDIVGIQETKCSEDKIPTEANPKNLGYHAFWSSGDKDGYAGTGLYSKVKPLNVKFGIGIAEHDEEGRVITAEYDKFYFVTAYVPNSGRGLPRLDYRQNKWDPDFGDYLLKLSKNKPIIVCGDLNVAFMEIDLANPKGNKRTAGFTNEERQGFGEHLLKKCDLVDTFRHFYPDRKDAYTFWSYMGNARGKNIGWRLDYFLVSRNFMSHVVDHKIMTDVMGSDHCPIVLYLNV